MLQNQWWWRTNHLLPVVWNVLGLCAWLIDVWGLVSAVTRCYVSACVGFGLIFLFVWLNSIFSWCFQFKFSSFVGISPHGMGGRTRLFNTYFAREPGATFYPRGSPHPWLSCQASSKVFSALNMLCNGWWVYTHVVSPHVNCAFTCIGLLSNKQPFIGLFRIDFDMFAA